MVKRVGHLGQEGRKRVGGAAAKEPGLGKKSFHVAVK